MINLRPYQSEAVDHIRAAFASGHKRVVLCMPTGAGKTATFTSIVSSTVNRGKSVLVLTDRTELFNQTIASIGRNQIPVSFISPDSRHVAPNAKCYVGMVETLKRRIGKSVHIRPDLIIIDEAHKGNFNRIFELFPDSYYIGATATPVGKHFHKLYTHIVNPISISDLISDGYLVPCHPFQMQDDLSDLEQVAGEYTESSQFNHYNKAKLYDGVITEWQQRAAGLKTIVFNCNIEHSLNMTEQFKSAGIKSYCITSRTPDDERKWILSEFSRGTFPVLNNCGILTTGYDEPSIECVIMNRATMSLPLWLQCCGRGSRTYPNKRKFVLLDFGLNHDRHGLWAADREWSLDPPKKRKSIGAAPVKSCPECAAMIPASARICQFCSNEFKQSERDLKSGTMVEFIKSPHIGKQVSELSIFELSTLNSFKSTYIWRVVRSRGTDAIREYARYKGYKYGWIKRQLDSIEDSSHKDYVIQ